MSDGLPSASLVENARFNALVVVPNALQGIFRRRRAAVAAATRADVDGWAVRLLRGMRRSYDGGPVWVRVIRDPALLVMSRPDVRRVLEDAPAPFAADPPAKRDGMAAFQPHALTISRGEAWENRRRFTETVLDTGLPHHRLAERVREVSAEETEALLADARGGDGLRWDPWQAAFRRIARRVVLGDGASDDTELTDMLAELMSEANSMPGEPGERFGSFMTRLSAYVEAAEPGSLCAFAAEAPHDEGTDVAGQLPHWLFATHDTLATNAFRALALIAAHDRALARARAELDEGRERPYLGACLQDAMRLYPTTPMLSRETTAIVEFDGEALPAGTQVLIVNSFMHRDPDRVPYADRFAPEEWLDGGAAGDWAFNHFSHGPQGCPGAGLALAVGGEVLAAALGERSLRLASPKLDPSKPLPHMLDFYGIRFQL